MWGLEGLGWGLWGCVVDVEYAPLRLSSASLLSAQDGVSVRWYRMGVAVLADGGCGGRGEKMKGLVVFVKLKILQGFAHRTESAVWTVLGMLRLLIAYTYCTKSSTAASVLHVMCSFKASKISGITMQNARR